MTVKGRRTRAALVVVLVAGVAGLGGRGASATSATAVATWRPVSTPQPTLLANHFLTAISCPTTVFCMAVGSSRATVGIDEVPATETFDGRTWKVQHPPTVSPDTTLTGVSCLSDDDCTVVGTSVVHGGDRDIPVAEHWNGESWRMEFPVSPRPGGVFAAVSCPTSSTCISVGRTEDNVVLAERWRSGGVGWTVVNATAPGGGADLTDLSCSAYDRCVAVGFAGDTAKPEGAANVAESFNGRSWTADAIPTNTDGGLGGVSCPTADSCVAVGDALGPNGSRPVSYILRVTTWSARPVPNSDGQTASSSLTAIACQLPSACIAVGNQTRTSGTAISNDLTAKSFDGSTWTPQTIQPPTLRQPGFYDVSCPTSSTCFGVGSGEDADGRSRVVIERMTLP